MIACRHPGGVPETARVAGIRPWWGVATGPIHLCGAAVLGSLCGVFWVVWERTLS